MKKENNSKVEDIFKEIQTWENAPINELLGAAQKNLDQSIKRVIVYGPTQVGKTTLIMDLIGIKTDLQKDLEKILRGGALKGTSSTSCAIVYNRWDDNCFGLRLGNIDGEHNTELMRFDSDAFRKKIKEINAANRNHAESKADISTHDILYYYIPDSFFTEDAPNKNLQIVDLPGFGERNEQMRRKADEIIRYLSGIVAGAIVVVKSENVQKLETDYKSFIDQHHQNHLAIVVSYAIKTSSELKCKIADLKSSKTDLDNRSLAIELSEYYRNIIMQEGYMQFDDSIQSQIVFPVEHSVYLTQNYPELAGVFSESRKLLQERVECMKNRTSIEACIEELQQRQKKLEECVRNELVHQCNLDKELEVASKACIDIEKRLQAQEALSRTLSKQLNDWTSSLNGIKSVVNQFSERKLMTKDEAYEFWRESSGKAEEQQSQLYTWLHDKIDRWLKEKGPVDKALFHQLQKCTDQVLGAANLEDMLKRRDACGFLWLGRCFGSESCIHASLVASRILKQVQEEMNPAIAAYEKKEGSKYHEAVSEADHKLSKTSEERKKYIRNKDDIESSLSLNKKRLTLYEKQIKQNVATQKNVRSVFVRHYKQKEEDLLMRIEKATEPEIKAALFLTLSAINMTMQPYMEEKTNG